MNNLNLKIAALFMGLILWIYVSLNQSYSKSYQLALRISNLPKQMAIETELPESLNVVIEGLGWDLLFFDSKSVSIALPLNRSILGDTTIHFNSEFLASVPLPRALRIDRVNGRQNYKIRLEPRIERNLPIVLTGEFYPAPNYLFTADPKAVPATMNITGARKELIKLTEIQIQPQIIEGMKTDTAIQVALQERPMGIDFPFDSITIEFKVQKTAKRILQNIPVQLIPLSKLETHRLLPKTAQLTIVGGENDIADLSPEDFYLYMEFNRFQIEDKDSLPPSIRLPETVKSYQINPSLFKLEALETDSTLKDSL